MSVSPTKKALQRKREFIELNQQGPNKRCKTAGNTNEDALAEFDPPSANFNRWDEVESIEVEQPPTVWDLNMHRRFAASTKKLQSVTNHSLFHREHSELLQEMNRRIESMNVDKHLSCLDNHLRDVIEHFLSLSECEDDDLAALLRLYKQDAPMTAPSSGDDCNAGPSGSMESMRASVGQRLWRIEELGVSIDLSERLGRKIQSLLDDLLSKLFHLDNEEQVEAIHCMVTHFKDEIAHASQFAVKHESDVQYLNSRVQAYEEQAERLLLHQKISKIQTPTPEKLKAMLMRSQKEELVRSKTKNNAKWQANMSRARDDRDGSLCNSPTQWMDFDKENKVNSNSLPGSPSSKLAKRIGNLQNTNPFVMAVDSPSKYSVGATVQSPSKVRRSIIGNEKY